MRILGVETSGPQAGIALLDEDQVVATGDLQVRGRTGEKLTELAAGLLRLAGWELRDLHRIAVDVGPGSFTGLRVGLALAKGLSLGSGLPVSPVSSLEALAMIPPGDEPALASLPAPRGMVYGAAFARGPLGLRCILGEDCWSPEELWETLAEGFRKPTRLYVLGPMARGLEERAGEWDLVLWPLARPTGLEVARIASGPGCPTLTGRELAGLVPRYIRGADVRKPKSGTPTQTAP